MVVVVVVVVVIDCCGCCRLLYVVVVVYGFDSVGTCAQVGGQVVEGGLWYDGVACILMR